MSNMLVSLLVKVRQDGIGALKAVRDQLTSLNAEKIGQGLGEMMAFGFRQGKVEAEALKEAVAETRKEGKELVETLVHGTLGAAAAIYAFKTKFLDVAVEAEKARTRLKAIEESPGRAEAAMAVTEAFRAHTATTLADVRQSWIELRTHGMAPTNYTLTAIADTAEATGRKMAEVAREVGDAVEGGRYHTIREYGIEAKEVGSQLVLQYRYLGKVIREAVPKDNKLLVENKLLEILSKRFGGAAAEASKGWEGMLLEMHESWNRFALDVMEKGGVFKVLKEQLDRFIGGKDAEEQARNAEGLARGFTAVIVTVGDLVAWLRRATAATNEFLQPIGGLKTVLVDVVAAFYGFRILRFVWSALQMIGPAIGLVVSAASFLIPAIVSLTGVVYALGVALMTTPVGWIVMGIAAVIAAAWLLYNNWDTVVSFLGTLWDGLVADFTDTWDGIKAASAHNVDEFIKVWEGVKSFFVGLWSFIRTGWDNSIGLIVAGIDKVRGLLPDFGGGSKGASGGAIGGAVAAAGGKTQVDGKLQLEVTVRGAEGARITGSGSSGPIDIDPTLGLAGGLL
jgi:hypothetical protein